MHMLTQLKRGAQLLAAVGLSVLGASATLTAGVSLLTSGAPALAQDATQDTLILKNGTTVVGKILEETPTEVRMNIVVAGITADVRYPKSDILEVVKAAAKPDAAKPAVASEKPPTPAPKADAASGKTKVYYFELTGWFGEDISETPVRDAMNDAKKVGADYIIIKLDNDWSLRRFGNPDDIKDDVGQFDQLFRAERLEPVFTEDLDKWTKKPTVIIWVSKAMGGASFLPFLSSNIYFSSEGKMGGIGHLQAIFGSMGDKVVREKQFALRLKHAEGKAIEGGYDPKIVRAMARDEYVLSVRFEGGKPVLLERMPESADEILLTDDGEGANADDEEALARGEGNDCLTLKADIAYKLGISKGTADTLEDLVYQLGLSRTSDLIKGPGNAIMKAWREAIEDAKRSLPKLWREANEVQVKAPGGYNERTQARGKRKSILTQMQQIENKYKEALNLREIRVPDWNQIETIKKQLELEQLADKPDKRR